ncbi:MAG: hypothetical protein D6681_19185 [Calditrichaeota bacterium]|nr:MAG: hypothetical protein D6681_19185 [Calditrichota bacterium]
MAKKMKKDVEEELEHWDEDMDADFNEEEFDQNIVDEDVDMEDQEEEPEEDLEEVEDIEAKLESGEAFATPITESPSLLMKARIVYSCPRCRKIFFKNKWIKDTITDLYTVRTEMAYCDRCLDKYPGSFVGSIEIYDRELKEKKEDIVRLAQQVELELENRQPFEKIIDITEKNEILYIFTNTTRLAVEIARTLRREYHGAMQYEWFERNQFVRAKWYSRFQDREYFKKCIRASKEQRFGLFSFEDDFGD